MADLLLDDIFKEHDGPTGDGLETAQRVLVPVHPAKAFAKPFRDLIGGQVAAKICHIFGSSIIPSHHPRPLVFGVQSPLLTSSPSGTGQVRRQQCSQMGALWPEQWVMSRYAGIKSSEIFKGASGRIFSCLIGVWSAQT